MEKLTQLGKDITKLSVDQLPKDLAHAGFIIINTYSNTKYTLGDGPLNDGYNMAKCLNMLGYDIFYLIDSKKEKFLEKLKYFVNNVTSDLVVYYVGHGINVKDLDGDEDDGYDEAMLFINGTVIDDVLIEYLIKYKNQKSKIVLVTDACHSGTIWDIQSGNANGRQLPSNIISISATSDKQTAKQTVAGNVEQGMFTYYLTKLINSHPNLNSIQIKKQMKKVMKNFQQTVTIASTSMNLITDPLFKF